jgi:parallel beta-helix repeat protein
MRKAAAFAGMALFLALLAGRPAEAALPVAHLGCGDSVSSNAKLGRSILNCSDPRVLTITTSNVTLDLGDFTLEGVTCNDVIAVDPGLTNVRIKGPGTIRGCATGIEFSTGVNASKVTGVHIRSTSASAIELNSAPSNLISGNSIAHNNGTVDVLLNGTSSNVKILGNEIANNSGNAAIRVGATSHRVLVSGNRIVGNDGTGVELNDDGTDAVLPIVQNNVIRFNSSDGVDTINGAIIRDNVITENDSNPILLGSGSKVMRNIVARNQGFAVLAGSDNLIKENTFTNNTDGVDVDDGNTIVGNVLRNNRTALRIGANNTLTSNIVSGSGDDGVNVSGANNVLSANTLKNNAGHGLLVGLHNGNVVKNNKVIGNRLDGINFNGGVTTATIKGNTANKNGFDDGVGTGNNFGIRTADLPGIGVDGTNAASGNDVAVPAVQCSPDRLCA